MNLPCVLGDLDVVPRPAEIQRRIAAASRVKRLLENLLKVSIAAENELANTAPAATKASTTQAPTHAAR